MARRKWSASEHLAKHRRDMVENLKEIRPFALPQEQAALSIFARILEHDGPLPEDVVRGSLCAVAPVLADCGRRRRATLKSIGVRVNTHWSDIEHKERKPRG